MQYHPLGLSIPGRVNSSIRFRGMDVNSQVPTFQLGTLFVDGIMCSVARVPCRSMTSNASRS